MSETTKKAAEKPAEKPEPTLLERMRKQYTDPTEEKDLPKPCVNCPDTAGFSLEAK